MTPEDLLADDVDALLETIESEDAAAGKTDRRRFPRSPATGHVPAVVRRPGSATVRASLRDLSRSGAGLYSPVPLEPGEQVDLELDLHGRTLRAACRVATCRCGPDGRHILGLEFQAISRPSEPAVDVDDRPDADAVASRRATTAASHPAR